jgi:hypothetical protein
MRLQQSACSIKTRLFVLTAVHYSRTAPIRINGDGELSGYAENPDS